MRRTSRWRSEGYSADPTSGLIPRPWFDYPAHASSGLVNPVPMPGPEFG